MAFKFKRKSYDTSAEFIVGDHYVNVKRMHEKATTGSTGQATLIGEQYVVTAGTLIPDGDGNPLGLCFRDVDVTDGDAMIAVTVHAVVDRSSLPQALTYEQETALKGIVFINGTAPTPTPDPGT